MQNKKTILHELNEITLVAVATTEVEATVKAIEYSTRQLKFARVLLLSHYNPNMPFRDYEFIKIDPFKNVGDWGKFVIFELYKHINTKRVILIHADGFIVNPECWNSEFLKYDYIGAPWPVPRDNFSYRDYYGNIIRVGNSVSLRSYKILEMPAKLGLSWSAEHGFFHEDGFLCVAQRHILQEHGIKYAPLSVACYFSHEHSLPETRGIKPFAFHRWHGSNKDYPRFSKKASRIRQVYKVIANKIGGRSA